MNKRRCIEIRTFRSRTTITVRDQDQPVRPARNTDTSAAESANLQQAEDGGLKPSPIAQSLPADLARIKFKE